MNRLLFVTWDGPQVRYLESLFLPIFKGLAEHGHQFHILQFTWGNLKHISGAKEACRDAGIPYRHVKVNKFFEPFGPFLTAVLGARQISKAVRDWKIDTLMPRGLMPALATLFMKDRTGLRLIFDADGFPADERVDFAGLSPHSLQYRILRDIEAQMLRTSDYVLTRTDAAASILRARAGAGTNPAKYYVVSNGRADLPAIRYPTTHRETLSPVLCYLGSIGPQYCPDRMLSIASSIRSSYPSLQFKIFTANSEAMEKAIVASGITDQSWITIECLTPDDVSNHLVKCDVGFSFRQPAFSTQGISPIKLGDYLLAGLPIIGSVNVGNTRPLIEEGIFCPSDGTNQDEIVEWFKKVVIQNRDETRTLCRRSWEKNFSIKESIFRYLLCLNELQSIQPNGNDSWS